MLEVMVFFHLQWQKFLITEDIRTGLLTFLCCLYEFPEKCELPSFISVLKTISETIKCLFLCDRFNRNLSYSRILVSGWEE